MSPRILTCVFLLLPAFAQTARFDTVLYGAAYYHEYMPYDRLDKDIELMKNAGLSVVRLGESTWSSFEPADGRFEFAWMDRILDKLHAAGIKVIFGTPTYSIPPWLYHKHPEILVTKLGGQKAHYGIRQNMDISSPTYRYYCERLIRQLMAHYKDHPSIIGYQIDNETTSYGTAGPSVQAGFVEYLKNKFGDVKELNRVWGLVYWGQLLGGWEEVPERDGILNPGWKLEWERYQYTLVTDFLAWQARIVREYKKPGQFITQDFSGGVHTDIDQWAIAKTLDIVATNPYYAVQDQLDGHSATLTDDVARSLKQDNFLVTETNAQTIGWDSKRQFPPYDGQLRLNVYSHLADGANMVEYWHWHSLHYGQETYWKGILSHDLEPNRVYQEFSRTAHELQKIGPKLVNLKKKNDAAILFSADSFHGIQFMPFSDSVNYMTILIQMHRALYDLNTGVDFVTPDSDFSRYKLLLVPPLYVASDATLNKISQFVGNGGHVLMAFKSGFTNEYDTVRAERAPGPLRKVAGFTYQEFSNLREPLALKGDPFKAGDGNKVSAWAEMILPETAKPLAFYDHPFFERYPAILRNQFGKGTLTYEGTALSDQLQRRVIADVLQVAGLTSPDQQLPASIRAKHGVDNAGKPLHYYLNYSSAEQRFVYPHGAGVDLLTGKTIGERQEVTLAPWDLIIVEENATSR
jgi:beta-galactosidase